MSTHKVSHKTDKKLFHLDITTIPELKKAYSSLKKKQKRYGGRIIAQEWIQGINLILGARKDESFTKLVMIGSGGIYTEIFNNGFIYVINTNISRQKFQHKLSVRI